MGSRSSATQLAGTHARPTSAHHVAAADATASVSDSFKSPSNIERIQPGRLPASNRGMASPHTPTSAPPM